jgi:hypothetical protein
MDYKQKKFDYLGNWNIEGHCFIYVNNNLVIATQAADSHTTSITNMGINLPLLISKSENINKDSMIYIEHYEKSESDNGNEIFWLINLSDNASVPERITLNDETITALNMLVSNDSFNLKLQIK